MLAIEPLEKFQDRLGHNMRKYTSHKHADSGGARDYYYKCI